VTWGLGFSGLMGRTVPFSHLLRHTRGCGGSILTRILTVLGRNPKVIMQLMCLCSNNFPGSFVISALDSINVSALCS
jgi:hypothetical protein